MKILMLGWELSPYYSGGLGVACYQIAQALAQSGVEIDYIVPFAYEQEQAPFMRVISATKLSPTADHMAEVSGYATFSTSQQPRMMRDQTAPSRASLPRVDGPHQVRQLLSRSGVVLPPPLGHMRDQAAVSRFH